MHARPSAWAQGAQRAAKRSKYGGEPSWWNQRTTGLMAAIVSCAKGGLPDRNAALHQCGVAREAAEELVRAAGLQLRNVEGHRGFAAGADHPGVGHHPGVARLDVVVVQARAHAVGE